MSASAPQGGHNNMLFHGITSYIIWNASFESDGLEKGEEKVKGW